MCDSVYICVWRKRFFPGNQPAGIAGITKKLLSFLHIFVNPLAHQVANTGTAHTAFHAADDSFVDFPSEDIDIFYDYGHNDL